MKIADLYIRVSTDEQAERGYSQRSQEELLHKYCSINNFSVRYVIIEDHSARTFNRPEWKKYLSVLKRNKNQADLVLFLKWDRFSHNAGDAYQMINTLRKSGIEPQAIEQPLDLSIAQNSMDVGFSENKKGQTSKKADLSSLVALHGHFSNHFIPDLTKIAELLTA